VTEARSTARPDRLQAYFEEMVHRGLEGVVAKRPDATYRAGARGYEWVKLKRAYQSRLRDTVDLVLIGYLRGRGKRTSLGIGSLLAAVYDPTHDRFRTVAKIGSGLSDAAWQGLRARLDRDAIRVRHPRVDSVITPDVWELRDSLGLPGMAVLVFGFAGNDEVVGFRKDLPQTLPYDGVVVGDEDVDFFVHGPNILCFREGLCRKAALCRN
jgi:hypothetical protein